MHLLSPRRPRNDDERILPLINVVFLLLIFFMLAGRLAASDPFTIGPPKSLDAGPVEIEDLLVQVGADGRLALNGEPMDRAALAAAVADRVRSGEAGPGAVGTVRLKADGAVAAADVVSLMDLLREAGVMSLQLLTLLAGDR